jgi:hypothetical protein
VFTNGRFVLDQLREFATKQDGWEIVVEYVDVVSGSGKRDRVKFDAMMHAASKREFVYFCSGSWIGCRARVRRTLVHLTLLDGWGISWRSYQEPYLRIAKRKGPPSPKDFEH